MANGITAEAFAGYPPQARALAARYTSLLRSLPLPYLLALLREVKRYDWSFPAERRRIEDELLFLSAMKPGELAVTMAGFAALPLPPGLPESDWASDPAAAMERMTACLWSSHSTDRFRAAAESYTALLRKAMPPLMPEQPRMVLIALGRGAPPSLTPLFRKLRPHGVYLRHIVAQDGMTTLLQEAIRRAGQSRSREPFQHWYIDGGEAMPAPGLTELSYESLRPARTALLRRTEAMMAQQGMGPERLRSELAQMRPDQIGLQGEDAVRDHFALSLLTEGAGTQIFSTTFVQWAARECLRRAEPETLLLRYGSRQRQQPMNRMLTGSSDSTPDPAGSLVDADMGAFYTWLNLRRLPGAEDMRFLVWLEGRGEAVAIGPGLPQGTTSDSPLNLRGVLKLLA